MAGKNAGGRQIAPNDFGFHGIEIAAERGAKAETAQASIRELHAVNILILGEDRILAQKRHEAFEDFVALRFRHEPEAERRSHGVDVIVASPLQFGIEIRNVGVDKHHARVFELPSQMAAKARIDFEDKQPR